MKSTKSALLILLALMMACASADTSSLKVELTSDGEPISGEFTVDEISVATSLLQYRADGAAADVADLLTADSFTAGTVEVRRDNLTFSTDEVTVTWNEDMTVAEITRGEEVSALTLLEAADSNYDEQIAFLTLSQLGVHFEDAFEAGKADNNTDWISLGVITSNGNTRQITAPRGFRSVEVRTVRTYSSWGFAKNYAVLIDTAGSGCLSREWSSSSNFRYTACTFRARFAIGVASRTNFQAPAEVQYRLRY